MPHARPLVSIITPTFNHRQFIGRCLESTIGQTEPRWEQIVIDDGTTDGTDDVVRGFADARIRYVRQEHQGILHLAGSYNKALAMATGHLVAVLEGDDFWPVDKLQRQIPVFERDDIVLSWGRAGETDSSGEVKRIFPPSHVVTRMQNRGPAWTLRRLLEGNYIPACTVICRRSALEAVGGFQQPEGIPATDYPTWLELCRVGSFVPMPDVLGFWRRHDSQVTEQMALEMLRLPALDWAMLLVDRLSPADREALGISATDARRIDRNRRASLDFSAGRAALRADRNAIAEALFRRALRTGAGRTQIAAMLGLGCAYLGFDLDRVVTIGNRVRGRGLGDEL